MEIDKIATLSLQPDDVLVLKLAGRCSDEMFEHIKAQFETKIKHKIIIIENGAELQVLKPALKWTSDLPTQDGYYWYKIGSLMTTVEVRFSSNCFKVCFTGSDSVSNFCGEWYGPIDPPEYVGKEEVK